MGSIYPTWIARIQLGNLACFSGRTGLSIIAAQRKIRQIQKYYNKDHGPFPQQLLARTSATVDTNTVPYARALPLYYHDGLISYVY